MSARIVFMGTPDFAVPALTALVGDPTVEVVGVVTQPDRPSGRGKKLSPSPVKVTAEQAGLPVLQPNSLKPPEAVAALAGLQADLIVVAAFGQILRPNVLTLPAHGCVNIHASLLPRWRGAAPVNAAIRAGDAQTGITLMLMDEGLDTGPIIAQRAIPIRPDHTAGALTVELAELGAALLLDTLPAWLAGNITPRPQDPGLATLAPRLRKEDGRIDWTRPAVEIERQVRAMDPWPGAYTAGEHGQFKLLAVALALEVAAPPGLPAGVLFKEQRDIYATTGRGVLRLVTVQPAGRREMSTAAMLNGQPEWLGAQLG